MKDTVCDNLVFKPQLFDLTEMYGTGNEPTTVEEFKADFPEDLYEYTPYCWASMKNIRYLDTTKNLFDIPLTQGYPSDTYYSNDTNRTFTLGTYIVGIAPNNYFIPANIRSVSFSKNSISFQMAKQLGYGVAVPFHLSYGKTYSFSCVSDNTAYFKVSVAFYSEGGEYLSNIGNSSTGNSFNFSFTPPENSYYSLIIFSGSRDTNYTFSNIQLELGSTVTDYVPYGYLPLK